MSFGLLTVLVWSDTVEIWQDCEYNETSKGSSKGLVLEVCPLISAQSQHESPWYRIQLETRTEGHLAKLLNYFASDQIIYAVQSSLDFDLYAVNRRHWQARSRKFSWITHFIP